MGRRTHSDINGGSLFAADPEQAFDRQSIFWAPEALSTVLSLRESGAASDASSYALDWTSLAASQFRHGPDGWHGVVPLGGAVHRLYLPVLPEKGAPLSIELPLDVNADL